ncbi:MAG: hypothetical protein CL876_00210 [Dehalococcoidales bacterium]|nr:hypothetical protein [Dehalococcoidales bacterium]
MEVAEAALKAGAAMINDVTGLERDDKLAGVAGRAGVPVVLVSNQRERPGNYDIMAEVISSLERSIGLALEKGVATQNIIVNPGIGFGKSPRQNLTLIHRLAELKVLGKPILLGTSRKFMTGQVPDRRLEATSATVAIGIAHGVDMVRVHDVGQMVPLCRMSDAIIREKTG